jgi:hypothetical protein
MLPWISHYGGQQIDLAASERRVKSSLKTEINYGERMTTTFLQNKVCNKAEYEEQNQ